MKISQAKDNSFLKLDTLIMYKHNIQNITMACPDTKLKKVDFTTEQNKGMDIDLDEATKEEFLDAVNKANHEEDWYSLLLKDMILKQLKI